MYFKYFLITVKLSYVEPRITFLSIFTAQKIFIQHS